MSSAMNCADLEAVLPDVLDGEELEPAAAAHLDRCLECQGRLEGLRQVWEALDGGLDGDGIDASMPVVAPGASRGSPGSATEGPPEGPGGASRTASANEAGVVPPAPVVESIHQDLRALRRVRRTAPIVLGTAGLLVITLVALFPRRQNLFSLPVMLGPGSAVLFFLLAALALWQGLQLSGMMFRRGVVLLALVAAVFFLHGSLSGAMLPPEASGALLEAGRLGWQTGEGCLVAGMLMALPILGLAAWALRAARFPTLISSLVLGAGAGLAGAGVLQLHCSISTTRHLLMYHGGALALIVALAGAVGGLIARSEVRETVEEAGRASRTG